MPIVVKHSANPSLQAAGAFAAGRQKTRQGAANNLLKIKNQEKVVEKRADIAREVALDSEEQQQRLREFDQKSALERSAQGSTQRINEGGIRSEQRIKEGDINSVNRSIEFEDRLTAQQKADDERLRNAQHEIEQSDEFTPEQKEQVRRNILAKRAGIKALPARVDPSEFNPGQGVGEVFPGPGGQVFTRDPDKKVRKLSDGNTFTNKDVLVFFKQAQEDLTEDIVQTDKLGNSVSVGVKKPTQEAIFDRVRQMSKIAREISGQGEDQAQPGFGQSQPPPPQQNPDGSSNVTGQLPNQAQAQEKISKIITKVGSGKLSKKEISELEKEGVPNVVTKSHFEELPVGTQYIAPDGRIHVKR